MRFTIFAFSVAIILSGCATSQQRQSMRQTVSNAAISVFPGSPTFAEASISSDGSITLTKISEVKNPKITLTFNFTESNGSMMLSVKNPLDKTIKYHLNMIDYKGKPHNTSSCPVMAGGSVFESWPHTIPEISVSNTHIASENEEGLCIY